MVKTAPSIFLFALVQVTIHLAVVLILGKVFQFDLKMLLLASNANIGGPTTACGMAKAKRWESLIVPGILVGYFWSCSCNFSWYRFWTNGPQTLVKQLFLSFRSSYLCSLLIQYHDVLIVIRLSAHAAAIFEY